MAPANTPGRKKRDPKYFDVGVQGRKTGITVRDTGIRDENGLEPLEGIFSSPEKSVARRSIRRSNATVTSSEEMQVADSSAPEPTAVLSERRLTRTSKTTFPPPLGRSPIKTSLGSSPRRPSSVAPASPHLTNGNGSVKRALSHPAVHRRLDFSMDERPPSPGKSPYRGTVPRMSAKARADVYDIQPSPEKHVRVTRGSSVLVEEQLLEEQAEADQSAQTGLVNGGFHSSPLLRPDDDATSVLDEDDAPNETLAAEEDIADEGALTALPSKKRGRPRKSIESAISHGQDPEPGPMGSATAPRKRGRPRKNAPAEPPHIEETGSHEEETGLHEEDTGLHEGETGLREEDTGLHEGETGLREEDTGLHEGETGQHEEDTGLHEEDAVLEESPVDAPAAQQRGRGRKRQLAETMPPPPKPEDPPSKRGRTAADAEAPAGKKRGRKPKPRPSERDPNAVITSARPARAASVAASTASERTGPRSLQVLRATTPFEDDSLHTTRAGRKSFKPLAWWKGERAEMAFENGLPTIQEIIRAQDVTPVKRAYARGRRGRRRHARADDSEEEGEEEIEEGEEWILEGDGVLRGVVRRWDADLGAGIVDEEGREEEIAFAPSSIQTRDVPGAAFRYAKTMTLPFFGSGMVELPPGGFKRSKNARKMQMVFFVHAGKVVVEAAEERFVIGRGGVWQVPRGNFYNISNESERTAKIFFAQGCEVETLSRALEGEEGEEEDRGR